MTRSMITNRRKLSSDEAAPVLFRLPNLRSRDLSPADSAVTATTAIDVAGNSLRVDAPVFSPNEQPSVAPPEIPARQASADVTATTSSSSQSERPKGRGWMERIGSRLILLVTLVVIVSAAWLTGQHMPASKPDAWQATAVTPAEVETTFSSENADHKIAKAISEPTGLTVQPSASRMRPLNDIVLVEPSSSNQAGVGSSPDTAATLTAPANKSFPPQPLPTSVYKPSMDTGPYSSTDDVSSIFDAQTLEPTDLSESAADGAQSLEPFYQGNSVTSLSEVAGLPAQQLSASQTVSTTTPIAPVLDPTLLLPWLDEQNASRESRVSVTPNPIVDWSRYLPGADQSVRAASATQLPSNTMTTQQAGFPNGVTVNPYSR